MDSKYRAQLIREANAAFNAKDIRKARELYIKTEYKDGLVRMGDYFMYERRLPILAYGYYKKAGVESKIKEIFERMIYALSVWIGRDKFQNPHSKDTKSQETPTSDLESEAKKELNPDDFRVHPLLRQTAIEILKKQGIRV
jgi:hypothetical protein